ncbi:MAG: hypothetical protein Q8O76_11415, partial [Chloroflexota bacterium]|nr:hypothetical protein [Chloroflexota bacterium]
VFAKDHLAKLGIEAALQIKEQATFQEARVTGAWEAMPYPILAVELNEPDIILSRYLSDSPGNYGKYNNPAYDKLYEKQSQTLDAAERKKLILDMQRMLIEDPPAVPYFWDIRNELSWPWVKGFRWLNHYVGDWDLENVWLAR